MQLHPHLYKKLIEYTENKISRAPFTLYFDCIFNFTLRFLFLIKFPNLFFILFHFLFSILFSLYFHIYFILFYFILFYLEKFQFLLSSIITMSRWQKIGNSYIVFHIYFLFCFSRYFLWFGYLFYHILVEVIYLGNGDRSKITLSFCII